MYDVEDETPFTDNLLDQFGAYYIVTLLAVNLFTQWKLHYDNSKIQDAILTKIE